MIKPKQENPWATIFGALGVLGIALFIIFTFLLGVAHELRWIISLF